MGGLFLFRGCCIVPYGVLYILCLLRIVCLSVCCMELGWAGLFVIIILLSLCCRGVLICHHPVIHCVHVHTMVDRVYEHSDFDFHHVHSWPLLVYLRTYSTALRSVDWLIADNYLSCQLFPGSRLQSPPSLSVSSTNQSSLQKDKVLRINIIHSSPLSITT